MNPKQKRPRAAFCLIIVAIMLAGAGVCLYGDREKLAGYIETQTIYQELADAVVHETPAEGVKQSQEQLAVHRAEKNLHRPQLQTALPLVQLTWKPSGIIDFETLYRRNHDVVAWLRCDGTVINYPVVQNASNVYYLKHSFNRRPLFSGTIFVDAYNAPGFVDANTLLYGHNLRNGSMFARLLRYKRQAYYDEHPTMTLYTPVGDYLVELIAGYVVNMSAESIPMRFDDEEEFGEYLTRIRERSTFLSQATATTDDRLVTLITCSYEYSNGRYVVVGKLTPILYP